MGDVIQIFTKKKFTLEEANELLPVVKRITEQATEDIDKLATELDLAKDEDHRKNLEEKMQKRFQDWYFQVKKLGVEAKGLWLVDFDSGEGYYCWRYPEASVAHYHGYDEGFKNRVEVQ